ncbi:MAG: bifunctional glutamate N-acetyltransferase/amino-acid acetyltransferase ArgJ [Thermodesulfobacteriota bacterium]|nr:bifunctional glutamate N-acetyltransferase/amino-acid acetyltransferase ArgJ [Thermodesulfobacteriota bacterium]
MKVKGFSAAAVQAGIRYPDRLDLGLIYSEVPAVTAGVFTINQVKAAPVILDMERLRQGRAQAILVNSGNANACTGVQGMKIAKETGAMAADALGIDEELVLVASTGVIGEQLDPKPFTQAVPRLVDKVSADGFDDLARAIMTTDTVPKTSSATIYIDDTEVRLLGVAKGSGMIMPNMATMLCFVVTDAQIVFSVLKDAVKTGVELSFNRITVDGDTSTNDMVLVMANGAAGNEWIDEENPKARKVFSDALHTIFKDLALQIVKDGEGATKLVTVRVVGARDREGAISAARTIANSPLVKTAFFGEDANWGRIIAALGRSGCYFRPDRVSIAFDDVIMVESGLSRGKEVEDAASEVLKHKEFTVTVDLRDGMEAAEFLTCDFSYDYVKINADYRS